MSTLTSLIELAVGVACLVAGVGAIRRGSRLAGVVLLVGGAVAVVHAGVAQIR